MFKKSLLAIVILMIAVPVFAQNPYKAEVFGGYQLTRINPGSGVSGENFNGWNASVTANFSERLGFTGDVSGGYKDFGGVSTKVHNFLFGPTFSLSTGDNKVKPFVHALFGVSHASASFSGAGGSDNSFATALGGGVDVAVNKSFAVRLLQADYFMTRFGSETQNNARISAGIVFRF